MKVILLQDVPGVGKKHVVKDVNDGYAHNLLFPKKLAVPATNALISQIDKERAHELAEKKRQEEELSANLVFLEKNPISISAKVNEQGHLFKGLKVADIMLAIKTQRGILLPPTLINLDEPIKKAGTHTLPVTFLNKKFNLKITIVG